MAVVFGLVLTKSSLKLFKLYSHFTNMFPIGFRSVIFKSHTHDSNVESIECFLWFDHGYGSTFEIRVAPSLTF